MRAAHMNMRAAHMKLHERETEGGEKGGALEWHGHDANPGLLPTEPILVKQQFTKMGAQPSGQFAAAVAASATAAAAAVLPLTLYVHTM